MYLISGGETGAGERHYVFVDARPADVPAGWQVTDGVTLTTHPWPEDPNAPTVRALLYRDPTAPLQYHYLLAKPQAKHLRRVGTSFFVYDSWEEFAAVHPAVVTGG